MGSKGYIYVCVRAMAFVLQNKKEACITTQSGGRFYSKSIETKLAMAAAAMTIPSLTITGGDPDASGICCCWVPVDP